MKGGVQGKKMVVTIDVKNPQKITVANEDGQKVNPVPVGTLQKQPYNGVYHVNSAAILGRRVNPYCVIIEIFGQLYEI